MAKDKKSKVDASAVDATTGDAPLSTKDNVRLIAGFILMLIAAFIFCSIASYLFYWKADMSALQEVGKPMSNPQFYNICGQGGAKVASGLVGGGFGLFALVIPLVIGVIGWRLFRYKPLHLHKFLLIFTLVLLLGSLTLGYIFTDSWGVFGSGLGGRYGILINESLRSIAGVIGTLLIIIAGWILTGLLINRNFLQVVDNAGTQVAGGISNATRRALKRLNRKGEEVDAADADVESDEEQYEEATADGWRYLQLNDNIITSGNELYEGKMIS